MDDERTVRVLAISGGRRRTSSNLALIGAAVRLAPRTVEISIYRALEEIPPFNPDRSDFYRQGDGNLSSFTAKMIVSDSDLDPIAPGVQNIFIDGIGCATDATVSFN